MLSGRTGGVLLVRRFCRDDWDWVQEWFRDPVLDQELGPLDDEWLEHVLTDPGSAELVVIRESEPVALVGCVWGPIEHTVSDIAVPRSLRRSGVGSLALRAVLTWRGHPPVSRWVAYVHPSNPAAFGFFTEQGWKHFGIDDGMHTFRLVLT
ncbi:GNAT family N-acetyltransferase [Mycobacterium sp. NPDC050853]|uniref:GNAT family N-acetyltransferase n=1 Tax=Mycobacterium sp. NPDC050853 TaxID=3155160 RepID=UPI0033D5DD73